MPITSGDDSSSGDLSRGPQGRRLAAHRDEVLELAQRYGVTNVRVFGSVACGQDTEASDIDLLVDVPAGFTFLDMSALTVELSERLGVQVDVATGDLLREEIRENVLRTAIRL